MRAGRVLFANVVIIGSLLACGGKELNEVTDAAPAPDPDVGAAGAGGVGGGGDEDAGMGGAGGVGGAVEATPLVPYPNGCRSDDDCVEICRQGICVEPPPQERTARFACDAQIVQNSAPDLDCWARPPERASQADTATLYGKVVFFGQGVQTLGMTVRIYDFASFDPSTCVDAGAGIQDLKASRDAVEACVEAANTAIATTTTTECDPPDPESGCYSLDGIPTNQLLVARVTGNTVSEDPLETWVPTYSYGVYIDPCTAPALRPEAGLCPEEVDESPAGKDWDCDMIDGRAYRDLTVISQDTWNSFPPTAGIARIERGNGAVAGRMYDCAGRSIVNAGFGLATPGTKTTFFNGNPDDTLPQPGLTFTNTRGTYAELDTPAGPNGLVGVAWQDGELKLTAFDRFFVLPNTVVIINPNGRPPVGAEPPY